jgi:tetratricopeptide (TPR) repeat protein
VIAIVLLALVRVLRHARQAWSGHHWPRAGWVAAIAASGAHNMVDSDLYYFGLGFLVFLLLGVGLNMAVDGPSPEFAPSGQRYGFAAAAGVVALLMVHLASVEMQKTRLRYAIASGDATTARALAGSLEATAGWHGDYWYLRSAVAEPSKALADLERAAALAPTGRHLRALARARIAAGDRTGAEAAMNLALVRDPNDLATMEQLRDLYVSLEAYDKATEMTRRMIAIEATPYFRVRSLPEVIPMETYRARYWLAQRTEGEERLGELKAALPGYLAFASTTCALVIRALRAGDQQFAGISRDKAEATLTEGIAIAHLLADYDRASADDWRAKAADLAAVRAELTGASAGGSVGNTTSGIP